jgi:hypothetical protein
LIKNKIIKKNINFFYSNEVNKSLCPVPAPAVSEIPKWYKSLPKFVEGKKISVSETGGTNLGVKACASFLDAISVGYVMKLHCDILVDRDEYGEVRLSWSSGMSPISARPMVSAQQMPKVPGYTLFLQAWEIKYGIKVPKGYSVLITQPMNRYDLPTFTSSGIIDCDDWMGTGGIPFGIREDFEGIIPAGTPILQYIPFKRESWKSSVTEAPFHDSWNGAPRNKIFGWYKQNIWKKKEYL